MSLEEGRGPIMPVEEVDEKDSIPNLLDIPVRERLHNSSPLSAAQESLSEETLVEGAMLRCEFGESPCFLFLDKDHGVFSASKAALVNEYDCEKDVNIEGFGICNCPDHPERLAAAASGQEDSVEYFCEFCPLGKWEDASLNTDVDGGGALTLDSFLFCEHGGRIEPVLTGQDYIDIINLIKSEQDDELRRAMINALGFSMYAYFCGDPINTGTGNFVYAKMDISISGAYPIHFKRIYNSLMGFPSTIGTGWMHSFSYQLKDYNDNLSVQFADGHQEFFIRESEHSFKSATSVGTILVQDGFYIFTSGEGCRYKFDKLGRIIELSDIEMKFVQFEYEDNMLSVAKSPSGNLFFKHDKQGQLICVQDHKGRSVTYLYDNNELVCVQLPDDMLLKYGYSEGVLTKLYSPFGNVFLENTYDDKRRVVRQSFADSSVVTLLYDDVNRATVFTDKNGTATEYRYNEKFQTTEVIYEDGKEYISYNAEGQRIRYRDKCNREEQYLYNANGSIEEVIHADNTRELFSYDANGKLLMRQSPNGARFVLSYNEMGLISKATDPLGNAVQFEYDSAGFPHILTLQDGSIRKITRNGKGNIHEMVNPDGSRFIYEYDSLNNIVASEDANGNRWQYSYDGLGRVTEIINPDKNVRRVKYNEIGKIETLVDFNGAVSSFQYNALNHKLVAIEYPGQNTERYEYDISGNLIKEVHADGSYRAYEYDRFNRMVEYIDEEGYATRMVYGANGKVAKVTDANGYAVKYKYDSMDRLVAVIDAEGNTETYARDSVGNIIQLTTAAGGNKYFKYDLADQLIEYINEAGVKHELSYTPLGNVKGIWIEGKNIMSFRYLPGGLVESVKRIDGMEVHYEYDAVGNLVCVKDAAGTILCTCKYDSLNRLVEMGDGEGVSLIQEYDVFGRVSSTADAGGKKTSYKYSTLGDLVSVIDAMGNKTEYGYDFPHRLKYVEQTDGSTGKKIRLQAFTTNKRGETVEATDALGNVVSYTYDGVGNIAAKCDRDGLRTVYEYNCNRKVTRVEYHDGSAVALQYTPLQQLCELADENGVTRFESDILGRITKVTEPNGDVVRYCYNDKAATSTIEYPDGKSISYYLDELGRIKHLTSGVYEAAYEYSKANGMVSKVTCSDGIVSTYDYGINNQLLQLKHQRGDNVLSATLYAYDPSGNIVKTVAQTQGAQSVCEYTYDGLNRLTQSIVDGTPTQYAYDGFSNMVSKSDACLHSYNYDDAMRLVSASINGMQCMYEYDKEGALLKVNKNGQCVEQFMYDAAKRLKHYGLFPEAVYSFTYNGLGSPTAMQYKPLGCSGDVHTRYTTDYTRMPRAVLVESTEDGSIDYIWGNSLLARETPEREHLLLDHHDTVTGIVGDRSTMLSYKDYGALDGVPAESFHGYAGMRGVTDNLYYANARYYHAELGRFISQDPLKGIQTQPGTLNPYCYCLGDPIALSDPLGLMSKEKLNALAILYATGILSSSEAFAMVIMANGYHAFDERFQAYEDEYGYDGDIKEARSFTFLHETAQIFAYGEIATPFNSVVLEHRINETIWGDISNKEIDIVSFVPGTTPVFWEVKPVTGDASKQVAEYAALTGWMPGGRVDFRFGGYTLFRIPRILRDIGDWGLIGIDDIQMYLTNDGAGGIYYSFNDGRRDLSNVELRNMVNGYVKNIAWVVGLPKEVKEAGILTTMDYFWYCLNAAPRLFFGIPSGGGVPVPAGAVMCF